MIGFYGVDSAVSGLGDFQYAKGAFLSSLAGEGCDLRSAEGKGGFEPKTSNH